MAEPIETNIERVVHDGPKAVTAYIRGTEENPSAKIDRANEVLNAMKPSEEVVGIDKNLRKLNTRAVIDELDTMSDQIRLSSKNKDENLTNLQQKLSEVKKLALDRENQDASNVEAVFNQAREVKTEISQGEYANAAKRAGIQFGVPLAIGAAITWMIARGAKAKGFITRWFKRITGAVAGAAAAVVAYMAIRSGGQAVDIAQKMLKDGQQALADAKNLPKTLSDGAKDVWNDMVGGDDLEDPNVPPQQRLEQLVQEKKFLDAYRYANKHGGGLILEKGKASLAIEGGEPVSITPEGVTAIQELIERDENNGVWLWFEFGVGYFVSTAVARKILYGKPIYKRKWGKIKAIGRMAAGPLAAVYDLGKPTLTMAAPSGFEQVQTAYIRQSLPARAIRNFRYWARRKLIQRDIRTEKGLIRTIRDRHVSEHALEVLEMGIGETNPQGTGDIDRAKSELEYLTGRVKIGLNHMGEKNLKNKNLQELVGKRKNKELDDNLKKFIEAEGEVRENIEETSESDQTTEREAVDEEVAEDTVVDAEIVEEEAAAGTNTASSAASDTSAIESRIDALEEKFSAQSDALQSLQAEGSGKDGEIAALKEELVATETVLQAEREKMADQVTSLGSEKAELESTVANLRNDVMIESSKSTINQDNTQKLQAALDQKSAELAQKQSDYEVAKAELMESALSHESEIASLRQTLDVSRGTSDELLQTLQTTETENAELRSRLAAAEKKADEDAKAHAEQEQALRIQLEDAQDVLREQRTGGSIADTESGTSEPETRTEPDNTATPDIDDADTSGSSTAATSPRNPGPDRAGADTGPDPDKANPRPRRIPPSGGIGRAEILTPESAGESRSRFSRSGLNAGDDKADPRGGGADTDTKGGDIKMKIK